MGPEIKTKLKWAKYIHEMPDNRHSKCESAILEHHLQINKSFVYNF